MYLRTVTGVERLLQDVATGNFVDRQDKLLLHSWCHRYAPVLEDSYTLIVKLVWTITYEKAEPLSSIPSPPPVSTPRATAAPFTQSEIVKNNTTSQVPDGSTSNVFRVREGWYELTEGGFVRLDDVSSQSRLVVCAQGAQIAKEDDRNFLWSFVLDQRSEWRVQLHMDEKKLLSAILMMKIQIHGEKK
jgi:hypothetical protein